jgi:dipeptidyl aminopeptidase/acylaminoacyl peptidase
MTRIRPLIIAGFVGVTVLPLIQLAADDVRRTERGAVTLEDVPDIPVELVERMRPYSEARTASLQDWLHDGSMLISTRFGEVTQLHRVAGPGAARRQLTFLAEPPLNARVSPNPDHRGFIYSRDVGGNEAYQLFLNEPEAGSDQLLTDGRARNMGLLWSPTGDRFVYASTRRNGRDFDLYVAEALTPAQPRMIYQATGSWSPVAWAPDQQRLLIRHSIANHESRLFLLELASGRAEELNPFDQPIAYGGAEFSADGRALFLVSDQQSDYRRLRRFDLATKHQEVLTADLDWDVEAIELSRDGRTLAFTVNAGGWSQLFLWSTATGERRAVAGLPRGAIGGLHFSRDGERLGFTATSARSPGDAFALELSTGRVVQWTFSEAGGLDPATFTEPALIHYPTFDEVNGVRRTIPAFYYRAPAGRGPAPVLIHIHGGPEAQFRPTFNPTFEFYGRELGIAVIAPNVRGSTGYGREFLSLDDGFRREDSVRDIGALLDWIALQPELDASRVAVIGGSYGGYMSLASVIHFGDRLRAGISNVGITHFITFLESTAEYRRDLRRPEYGDERDPAMREFLHRISPLTRAGELNVPMLIAQGLNDPRVPVGEAQQMVAALRANGQRAWYFLAADEGHGFRRKPNAELYRHTVALFLQRHLIGESDSAPR